MNRSDAASWLELAATPAWRKHNPAIRIHAIGGLASGCFALTLEGRPVFSDRQRLTVFQGRDAVDRFLGMLRIEDAPSGEPMAHEVPSNGSAHCLYLHARKGLTPCQSPIVSDRS